MRISVTKYKQKSARTGRPITKVPTQSKSTNVLSAGVLPENEKLRYSIYKDTAIATQPLYSKGEGNSSKLSRVGYENSISRISW